MEILCPRLWIIIIGIGIAGVYAENQLFDAHDEISDTRLFKNRGGGPILRRDPVTMSMLFNPEPTTPQSPPLQRYREDPPRCVETPWQNTKIKLNFSHMSMGRFDDNVVKHGDVISLNLSHNFIKHIPANSFVHLPWLQVLDLSANQIPVEELLHFQNLGRLEELFLDDNNGTKDEGSLGKRDGARLLNLKKLHLRGNRISDFTVSLREFSPSLNALYLARNKISSTDFLTDLPQSLHYLDLDNNNIGTIGSYNLHSIQWLSMNHNELEVVCIYECNDNSLKLSTMRRLAELYLSGNKISRITLGDSDFSKPSSLILHVLDLSHNELTEISRSVLHVLRNLRKLNLSYNRLTEIPELCGLHALDILDLSGNMIETVPARSLCDITLQELNLSNNKISMISPMAFKAGGKALNLDLSNNQLSALTYPWIEGPGTLTVLRLENNLIADLHAVKLTGMVHLKELHITGNPLTHLVLNNVNGLSQDLRVYFSDGKVCPPLTVIDAEIDDSSSE